MKKLRHLRWQSFAEMEDHDPPGGQAFEGIRALVDESVEEPVRWKAIDAAGEAVLREARMPRVIFTR
jgi:hypothetical protein